MLVGHIFFPAVQFNQQSFGNKCFISSFQYFISRRFGAQVLAKLMLVGTKQCPAEKSNTIMQTHRQGYTQYKDTLCMCTNTQLATLSHYRAPLCDFAIISISALESLQRP